MGFYYEIINERVMRRRRLAMGLPALAALAEGLIRGNHGDSKRGGAT
jgi:hypothetical protein